MLYNVVSAVQESESAIRIPKRFLFTFPLPPQAIPLGQNSTELNFLWFGEPLNKGEKITSLTVKLENWASTLCGVDREVFVLPLFYANGTVAGENQ